MHALLNTLVQTLVHTLVDTLVTTPVDAPVNTQVSALVDAVVNALANTPGKALMNARVSLVDTHVNTPTNSQVPPPPQTSLSPEGWSYRYHGMPWYTMACVPWYSMVYHDILRLRPCRWPPPGCWLVGLLAVGLLACWLLACWLADLLVGWLPGWLACLGDPDPKARPRWW